MTDQEHERLDAIRWARAIPLLTLDVLRPLHPALGFTPRDPQRLQKLLRDQMIDVRRRFARELFRAPTPVHDVVSGILSRLGQPDASHLVRWIETVFHGAPTHNQDLRTWNHFLQHCRRDRTLWLRLFAGLQPDEALARFQRSTSLETFDERYLQVTAQTLSDWDLHLYAVYFFDDDDSEGAPNGPYLWIAPTARDFQSRQFWNWLLESFEDFRVAELWRRAQQIQQDGQLLHDSTLADPTTLGANL